MEHSEFICQDHIKNQYGVSISLIKKYFGDPDKTIPNPHCPSDNREIKLYNKKRIARKMECPDFQRDLAKSRRNKL